MTNFIARAFVILLMLALPILVVVLILQSHTTSPTPAAQGTCVFDPMLGPNGSYYRLAPGAGLNATNKYLVEVNPTRCS